MAAAAREPSVLGHGDEGGAGRVPPRAGRAVFDRLSRAATAPESARWVALLALGHAVGWTLLLLAVRG